MAEVSPAHSETGSGAGGPSGRAWDPRAIRVTLRVGSGPDGLPAIVLEPPETPAVAASGPAGAGGSYGGEPQAAGLTFAAPDTPSPRVVLVDGAPLEVDLHRLHGDRARLAIGGGVASEHRVLLPAPDRHARTAAGARREVVVDGWRFEVEVEPAARAALRERASRGRAAARQSGPTEVRAIIPGVVAAVAVAAGDVVAAGQQLLVIEAMKMQNELRAPRAGTIDRVTVGPGLTIDVGDLLVVIA